jgi:hypothetical protein
MARRSQSFGDMTDRDSVRSVRVDDLVELRERERYSDEDITKIIRIQPSSTECSCCSPNRSRRY